MCSTLDPSDLSRAPLSSSLFVSLTLLGPVPRISSLHLFAFAEAAFSVLVLQHGATQGSLLHEGSPVFPTELEGAKYVIRTEVLYEVERIPSAGEGGVVGGLV